MFVAGFFVDWATIGRGKFDLGANAPCPGAVSHRLEKDGILDMARGILGDPGQSVGSGERAGREFSSTGERDPGYRISSNYLQKFKRMPAPDWAQKMLCIIMPNRRTVSPEFFSWAHLPGSFTKLVRARISLIFYFPNQKRRNYRCIEKMFGVLSAGAN